MLPLAGPGVPFRLPNINRPDYDGDNRMFFGISSFALSRASRRLFSMDPTDKNSINTGIQTNEGTF